MPVSVTEAYRRDRLTHPSPFSTADEQWLVIGTLIGQTPGLRPSEQRKLFRQVTSLADAFLGGEIWRNLAKRDWQARPRRTDALLLLVAAIQEAGALHLASAIVDCLLASTGIFTALQRGRLGARRAQLSHRLNNLQLAAAQYVELDRYGRSTGLIEIRARAALGKALLAQLRGNYPQTLRHARTAFNLSRATGLSRLVSRSSLARMIASSQVGRHSEALVSAWHMYEAAMGDVAEESVSLVALGQLLLRLGKREAAYNAFAIVLARRTTPRVLLRALSGFAAASATSERLYRNRVLWAADEIRRLRGPASPVYDVANALLECAAALDAIDEPSFAEELRTEAMELGKSHGFNQVVFEAEAVRDAPRPAAIGSRASIVVRYFAGLEPRRPPVHVKPAGATILVG